MDVVINEDDNRIRRWNEVKLFLKIRKMNWQDLIRSSVDVGHKIWEVTIDRNEQ